MEAPIHFSQIHSFERRKEVSSKLRHVFPEKVHLILERADHETRLPLFSHMKISVPVKMTIDELEREIRGPAFLNLSEDQPLYLFAKGCQADIRTNELLLTNMETLYAKHQSEDGLLYIKYSSSCEFATWWTHPQTLQYKRLLEPRISYFYSIELWDQLQKIESPEYEEGTQLDYAKKIYNHFLIETENLVHNFIKKLFAPVLPNVDIPNTNNFLEWFGELVEKNEDQFQPLATFTDTTTEVVRETAGNMAVFGPTFAISGGLLGLALGSVASLASGGLALGFGLPLFYGLFQESKTCYDFQSSKVDSTRIKSQLLTLLRHHASCFKDMFFICSQDYWNHFKIAYQAGDASWDSLLIEWEDQWIFNAVEVIGATQDPKPSALYEISFSVVRDGKLQEKSIQKRYSQFRSLYEKLSKEHRFLFMSRFPKKTWTSSAGIEDKELLEERRTCFQYFLIEISRNPSYGQTDIREFLELV